MARAYRLSAPYRFTPARALALKKARIISAKNRHGRASSGIKVNYAPRSGPNASSGGGYRFTTGRRKALARARKVNKNKKAIAAAQRRRNMIKAVGIAAASSVAIGVATGAAIGVYRNNQARKVYREGALKIRGGAIVRHLSDSPQLALPIGKTARRAMRPSPVPRGGVIKVSKKGTASIVKRPRVKYNARRRRFHLMSGIGM